MKPTSGNCITRWIEADAYLFDIDGTLLNASGRAHYNAFTAGLKHGLGLECTIEGVPWHGSTDISILRAVAEREGISAELFSRALPQILARMRLEVENNRASIRAKVCPSIPELVRNLDSLGKLLGIASGNLETIGWLKVEAAGLRKYFAFGSFSDEREQRSDIFAHGIAEARIRGAQTVCIIGDTPQDVRAAKDNNVPVIAVATGIYDFEQLRAELPDACVSCCSDLLPLLPTERLRG